MLWPALAVSLKTSVEGLAALILVSVVILATISPTAFAQDSSSSCPIVPRLADDCLCKKRACPRSLRAACFGNNDQNELCPSIPAECMRHEEVREIDRRVHDEDFKRAMRSCLLGDHCEPQAERIKGNLVKPLWSFHSLCSSRDALRGEQHSIEPGRLRDRHRPEDPLPDADSRAAVLLRPQEEVQSGILKRKRTGLRKGE